MADPTDLSAEDQKLVTLARATRARTGAAEGGAVRDLVGRTYAAASVELPSLQLSALEVCVAMALSSGSTGLEAAVLLRDRHSDGHGDGSGEPDLRAVTDFAGAGIVVHLGDPRGALGRTTTT
ncbi:MAG: cytidine deaminase [Nocardioides sp.]